MLNEPFLKITNGPRPPYEIERPQMTIEFKIDQQLLGDGVKSADVAAVHVAVGDTVESGQIVMELETEWRRQGGDREGNARQVRCDA
jgi:hypothetical protein